MKRTTIKDVAQQAGVSITTVSHALSGGGVVKQETRDRIRALAREMNYSPNWNGKNLKCSETKIIGFYVSCIRGAFYGKLADAMHETCRSLGYELDILIVDHGSTILDNLMSHRVDGAIVLHEDFGEDDVRVLFSSGLPVVFLDREMVERHVSSVVFNSFETGYQAAKYLYGLGHRRLMLVEGSHAYDGLERTRGFLAFLKENELELDPAYRLVGNFDRNIASKSLKQFLQSGLPMPTAIFAENDDSAFGCINTLTQAGYSIPNDISILGCDNVELSAWMVPALTTMDTMISEQAHKAAEEIVALVQGSRTGCVIKTPSRLVERKSCQKLL